MKQYSHRGDPRYRRSDRVAIEVPPFTKNDVVSYVDQSHGRERIVYTVASVEMSQGEWVLRFKEKPGSLFRASFFKRGR